MSATMNASKPELNLYTLIKAVREELEASDIERREAGRQALLQLSEMELELNFVVTKRANAKAKYDLWVLSLGADAGVEGEKVQKIRLKFNLADTAQSDEKVPLGARHHSSSAERDKPKNIDPL